MGLSSGVTGVNRRELAGTARSQEHRVGERRVIEGEVAEDDDKIVRGHSASRQEDQIPASRQRVGPTSCAIAPS